MTVSAERPESVALATRVWVALVLIEAVLTLVNAAGLLADPAPLRQAAKEAVAQDMPDTIVQASLLASVALGALLQLTIAGVLGWLTWMVGTGHRWASGARRALVVFSIYFALRGGLRFFVGAAAIGPTWLVATVGTLEVISGVFGVVSAVFLGRKETRDWVVRGQSRD